METLPDQVPVILDGCARCGAATHDPHVFVASRFTRPMEIEGELWTHWAMCPATNEPVVIQFDSTDAATSSSSSSTPAKEVCSHGQALSTNCWDCCDPIEGAATFSSPADDQPRVVAIDATAGYRAVWTPDKELLIIEHLDYNAMREERWTEVQRIPKSGYLEQHLCLAVYSLLAYGTKPAVLVPDLETLSRISVLENALDGAVADRNLAVADRDKAYDEAAAAIVDLEAAQRELKEAKAELEVAEEELANSKYALSLAEYHADSFSKELSNTVDELNTNAELIRKYQDRLDGAKKELADTRITLRLYKEALNWKEGVGEGSEFPDMIAQPLTIDGKFAGTGVSRRENHPGYDDV